MAIVSAATAVRKFEVQAKAVTTKLRNITLEAHVSACNRVANSVRAQVVRLVRQRYPGFKAAAVRSAMKIARATYSRPRAMVQIRGRRTPLIAFSARQTKAGVSVNVRQRKVIQGAFIATMKSGHKGVFRRTGQFGRGGSPRKERIAELRSLSIPQAVGQELLLLDLRGFARQRYKMELARELKYRAGRSTP